MKVKARFVPLPVHRSTWYVRCTFQQMRRSVSLCSSILQFISAIRAGHHTHTHAHFAYIYFAVCCQWQAHLWLSFVAIFIRLMLTAYLMQPTQLLIVAVHFCCFSSFQIIEEMNLRRPLAIWGNSWYISYPAKRWFISHQREFIFSVQTQEWIYSSGVESILSVESGRLSTISRRHAPTRSTTMRQSIDYTMHTITRNCNR